MIKLFIITSLFAAGFVSQAQTENKLQEDMMKTSLGDLHTTIIGHASLMFTFNGMVIHVDPWSAQADYSMLPKADLVLITHEHMDHLDPKALGMIRKDKTKIILTEAASAKVSGGIVMRNGESKTVGNLHVEAVPAYNIVNKRPDGAPFHPKGAGNSYIVTFGDKRVYIAGDTENTPEMKALENIDVAFLPMNLPYTMSPEMVVDAAKAFQPKILYPYHFGVTDTSVLVRLLKDCPKIEIRIRNMK